MTLPPLPLLPLLALDFLGKPLQQKRVERQPRPLRLARVSDFPVRFVGEAARAPRPPSPGLSPLFHLASPRRRRLAAPPQPGSRTRRSSRRGSTRSLGAPLRGEAAALPPESRDGPSHPQAGTRSEPCCPWRRLSPRRHPPPRQQRTWGWRCQRWPQLPAVDRRRVSSSTAHWATSVRLPDTEPKRRSARRSNKPASPAVTVTLTSSP